MIAEQKALLKWVTFPTCEELRFSLRKVYLQSSCDKKLYGYVKKPFSTLVIDLSQSMERIQAHYDSRARYEIRRAGKDGLSVWYDLEVEDVIELFALTTEAKGLNTIRKATFTTKPEFLVSHVGRTDTGVLSAHFHLLDRPARRILLQYNCSAYRKFKDPGLRSLCGRANRYLFDRDFEYFKAKGFTTYDFGGYDPAVTDPAVQSVNKFKETLGGRVERQFNYFPLWYWWVRQLKNRWRII